MNISIIIPAYNINKYIEECIDSIIQIEEIEIIVVDDGSTEQTEWIRKKYSNFPSFNYYRKKNGGLSDARNFGIMKATQEYIMFLDGDDFIDTSEFKKAIKFIDKTRKKAYFFKYSEYYENDKKIIKEKEYEYDFKNYISVIDEDFIKNPFVMVAWRYIVKREFLIKYNLFFVKGIYHEDEEWTARFLTIVKKVYNLKMNILYYRQREGSITSSLTYKGVDDIFKIINLLSDYKDSLNNIEKARFINLRCKLLYKSNLLRVNKLTLNKTQVKKIIENFKKLKRKIYFEKNFKEQIIKYCPIEILLMFLKLKKNSK